MYFFAKLQFVVKLKFEKMLSNLNSRKAVKNIEKQFAIKGKWDIVWTNKNLQNYLSISLKILTGVSIDAPLSPSPGLPFNLSILFVGPGVSDAGGGEFLDE